MALWDEVKARWPAPLLKQLTNPLTPGAAAIDDDAGTAAATDVEGDFLTYAQTTFDVTSKQHVSLAVDGVLSKLRIRRGLPAADAVAEEKAWVTKLQELAKSRAWSRTRPAANTPFTPSRPNPTGVETRPPFDEERFESITPNAPEF